ncbi:MAG: DUF2306 domain-containing protein [Myxococcota bacterium]
MRWSLPRIVFWSFLILGIALVVVSSLPYVLPGGTHPFLDERPHLTADTLWRVALTVHVASGIFALPVGAFLFSTAAQRRWPALHARLGRVFLVVLVAGLVPSGTYLAVFAKGGLAAGSGFFLSGVFTAAAALHSVRLATQRQFVAHRDWMLRAYAQLASAITFRIVHLALQFSALSYEELYITSLWVSVLGNAVLAEVLIAAFHYKRRVRSRVTFHTSPSFESA